MASNNLWPMLIKIIFPVREKELQVDGSDNV